MPDEVFDKDYWDAKYRDRHHLWSGDPNPQLVAEATGLAPTTALDVGCGEGADAIWLARRGWTVTAVDLASTALQRAAVHAQEAGGEIAARIEWREEDVTSWIPEPGRFGLVSAQFLHFSAQERAVLFGRLAAAVAPGGTLLLVGHHVSDLQTSVARPPMAELYFTAEEVAAQLDADAWRTVCEARPRETTDPDGNAVTIQDTVLRADRTS